MANIPCQLRIALFKCSFLGNIFTGPSRITTTTTTSTITGRRTTTTSTVATRPRKAVRRRRKARRRRTYVVEYDVDSFDKKFSIKTTKKVIKRRRKTKRKTASRRSRCSSRRTIGQNEGNDAATSMLTKRSLVRSIEANYPKLHLFGNKNDLEYFPDDESDNDHESGRFESNNDLGGARGEALVMSSARFSMGVNRGLLKGKQMGSVRRRPTATVTSDSMASTDLLSNIMNSMDRWYSMSNGENIEKIKIGADGKLSIDGDSRDANKPPKSCPVSTPSASDVVNAPRNGPANDGNIQVGTSCQSNNDDRAGNDGGSFQMGGNGMSTEGGSASTETGTNAHRQGSGGGGVGPSDLGVTDSNAEPPRNRIMTRRRSKSALAPPPSLDEFPALNSCSDGLDLTMNSANQQNATATPNRIMTRRRSALAPPPSLDEFPALSGNNQSIPSGNQATPQTERTPGRVGLRRKSQLAATPALDSFSGLTSIDENAASAQTNNSQPSETPRRIMTRRRSNLAQPPTLDSFPALANTEGNGTPVASQPTRIMTRRRSATLAPPPSIMEFPALVEPIAESDVPDEACPPPPVPEIFGLFDEDDESGAAIQQPPPLSNYSFANSYMGSSPYSQNYGVLPPPVSASTIHESSSSVIAPDLSSSSVSPSKFVSKKKTAMSGGASSNTSPAAAAEEVNALPSAIDLNHKPTKIEWKNSPLKKKSVFNNSDDEDGGFQYSAESLEVAIKKHDAKNQKKGSDESKSDASENMEKDEDLVQLDDDDDVDDDDDDDETVTDDQPPTEKPIETVDDVDQSLAAKKNILDLHDDSDWEELRDDQFEDKAKQKPSPRKDDATKEKPENERSYTPCMDEQVVREEGAEKSAAVAECDENESTHTPDLPESHGRTSAGIDNMDTELISEDEDTDLLHDESGVRKDSAKKSKKKKKAPSKERENDEEFRKLSKSTKERRYREQRNKSASRSRSPSRRRTRSGSRDSRSHHRDSRSWSRNRRFNNGNNNNNNNSRGRRTLDQRFGRNAKRREIQRYNVRNVVADRQSRNYKDQYGRDEARPNRSPSRSPSPRRRSPARRSFSVSRSRSRSPYRRRRPSADSVRRSGSPQRRSIRSLSRSVSPKFTRYSRTPPNAANGAATTRSVSGSPRNRSGKTKSRKIKKKSGEKKSSKRRTKQRKNRDGSVSGADSQIEDRPRVRSRSKSWDANVRNRSWSRSVSPQPIARHSPEPNESWTPPIGPGSENLRITLANREKKKRREKKKKSDKHRSEQRKEKKRQRTETHLVTSNRPSKEVFASGDNILVSVSFNKEKEKTTQQQQTTIVTLPPTKDQIQTKKQTERNKKSSKDPNRKRKKLNVKPVAIIDLDNSPFKEMTPSPRAVIILSDSDNEREGNKENTNQQRGGLPNAGDPSKAISQPNDVQEHAVEVANSPPASPTMDNESFEMLSMGPKTPPEPRIKFALPKAKVRVVANPLHDTADDQNEDETNETDAVASQEAPANLQVPPNKAPGPNTPSDVGPYSPDAYDPFEPTKSPSPPPSTSESAQQPAESNSNIDSGPKKPSTENDAGDKESSLPDVIIVSPRSGDKAVADDATGSKPSSIHVFSNIVLSTGKETSARSQQPTQRSHSLFPPPTTSNTITPNKPGHSQAAKPSPMKFASSSLLARLPLPPSTKQSKSGRHNGNDGDGIGGESPYSPQSSDYDDLFEPPPLSPGPSTKKSSGNTRGTAGAGAVVFDDLFGSTSPTHVKLSKSSLKASKSSKHHEKSSIKGNIRNSNQICR